jgi:hypothetical protein
MKKRTSAVVGLLAAAVTAAVAPGAGAAGASLPAAGSSPARAAASYETSELTGVAAVSPSDVWAVGAGAHEGELVEHYDGQHWRVVKAPQPGASGTLWGVSADDADDVWAVGDDSAQAGPSNPVALHWDGTRWTSVAGMDDDLDLTGVAAVSPSLAWLVGTERKPADLPTFPRISSAIYRWDGSTLTRVSSPNPNHSTHVLGVAAASAKAAWAVGYNDNESSLTVPRVFTWTGRRWKTTKPVRDPYTILTGASATPNGDAWAVG